MPAGRAPAAVLLAIDTAGERCAACVLDAGTDRILARADPPIGRGHAERLFGIIDGVLAQADLAYGDLGRIAVTVGPGSFTGIRVGVAAARGLALALAVPAVGVTTLEALAAAGAQHPESPVLAVQDAKRGEVYAALFDAGGFVLGSACALRPGDLDAFCAPIPPNETLRLVGSGLEIASQALAGRRLAPDPSAAVDIAAVARIAARRTPGEPPRPLYLRGADAKPQGSGLKAAPAPAITA